ncbi:MAG: hypothetical protein KAS16_06490, partial [Thermoplasmata archaeon]|nr:hypothetical protein [Thermoplasmata archaeon]
ITTIWNETETNYLNETTDPGFFNSYSKAFWMQEPPGNLTAKAVTRGAVPQPETKGIFIETRYLDDIPVTVNGLPAYNMTLNQTLASYGSGITPTYSKNTNDLYTGMRVWIRHANTTETELTGGVAESIVSKVNGAAEGIQSTTWSCPDMNMTVDDAIVVRIYQAIQTDPPDIQVGEFITGSLSASTLEASLWGIDYYTHRGVTGNSHYGQFYYGNATFASLISNFQYNISNLPPEMPHTPNPANVSVGHLINLNLTWECSDPDGDIIYYDVYFGQLGDAMAPIASDLENITYYEIIDLELNTMYSWFVRASDAFNTVRSETWVFATGGVVSGGSGAFWGLTPNGTANINKTAVTESVDLRNADSATLSFWHKYNLISGENGGVLMVGYKKSVGGSFEYKYVMPSNAYTGSMNMSDTNRVDDDNTWMRWAWNGVSTRGTFEWEKVTMDILPHVPTGNASDGHVYRSDVRIMFAYYQYGSGSGYGWYIDDVRIEVSRADSVAPDTNTADIWQHTYTNQSHSGMYCWSNVDPDTGFMKAGIDNSLKTNPIDLTNARWAEFSAYFRFNINTQNGAPPDGFRVEVTTDNGVTWNDMTLGVRSAWNVSGYENDIDDDNNDGKSYSGISDSGEGVGNAAANNYWVEAGTLTRLNIDLTPYAGKAVQIRFRVVTTLTDPPTAYEHFAYDDVGFGGFWVDDVIVRGETTNVYG